MAWKGAIKTLTLHDFSLNDTFSFNKLLGTHPSGDEYQFVEAFTSVCSTGLSRNCSTDYQNRMARIVLPKNSKTKN